MRLYDYLSSGNGYKVRLLLTQLGIPFERIELDIDKGETRTPAFLAVNPNGRIPTLVFDDGQVLAESNAILFYLGEGTAFFPEGRMARAQVLQWMFFEQYSHEPYVAGSRFMLQHLEMTPARETLLAEKQEKGYAALGVMEQHLKTQDFFVGAACSIADIALYAYSHVADEGGFDLSDFPALRAWLMRVAAQPGHIPITQG